MDQNPIGGSASTGTRDSTYDLVAVLYHALQGVENCQTYLQDASGEQQLQTFFQQAMQQQRQLADQAKRLLHDQLMTGEGSSGERESGSAFSQFGGGSQDPQSSMGSQGISDDEMQRRGSPNDHEGGSAYTSGTSTGAQQNDPSMGQFGQSPMGGGQRHTETSTGGGGTSSF